MIRLTLHHKNHNLHIPPAKRGPNNNNAGQKTPRTPRNQNNNNGQNNFFDRRQKSNVDAKNFHRQNNNNGQNRPKTANVDLRNFNKPPSFVMETDRGHHNGGGKKQWRKDLPAPTEVKGVIPSSSKSAAGGFSSSKSAVGTSQVSNQ